MTPLDLELLSAGPLFLGGAYNLSNAVVASMGFTYEQFKADASATAERLRVGEAGERDLAFALFVTELGLVSSRFGIPSDWSTITGCDEGETLRVVRAVGRKRAWPEPPAPLTVEMAVGASTQLSPDEALLLLHGVCWGACIPPAFLDPPEAEPSRRDRVVDALQHGGPLDDDDLTLAIHMTELVFAGEAFGLGYRWSSSTGLADSSTLAALRLLQRRHRRSLCARRPPGGRPRLGPRRGSKVEQ